jgi:hypothetical protein
MIKLSYRGLWLYVAVVLLEFYVTGVLGGHKAGACDGRLQLHSVRESSF